ncbi:glycosyltransferase family 39 protein [Candidatus Sumerlaeota bacterium]|nr:glycosyltransferase family 39 protein [Candidatus Sumerlaeota bacterium]
MPPSSTEIPATSPKGPSDAAILAGFALFNAVLRYALIGINAGEYTDGIIQIVQFDLPRTFWPPLYPALIQGLVALGVEPIPAGRLISWAASVLLVFPMWSIARAWGGRRTALFALALYSASPVALRWSIRVMTDMPFALFFMLACAGLLSWRGGESARREAGEMRSSRVAWATLLAVAATMTRYQGLMLAPLTLWAAGMAWRGRARGRWAAVAAQIVWLALPIYLATQRFGHIEQIVSRQSPSVWATLLNYWYCFEMFLFLAPYVLTLPVFVFFAIGIVQPPPEEEARRPAIALKPLFLYVALAVLCSQSVFQSFQSRYLLPSIPFALICAGAGMARAERFLMAHGRRGRAAFFAAVTVTVCVSAGFALASVSLQRGAFGDIFAAGRRIREMHLAPGTRIFSNETYTHANGVKLAFASGRAVELIPEVEGRPERMPPGSIIAVHTAYGGPQETARLLGRLRDRYNVEPIQDGRFVSRLVPLLPDIMEEPLTHQNPLAWLLRYRSQYFETMLLVVKS